MPMRDMSDPAPKSLDLDAVNRHRETRRLRRKRREKLRLILPLWNRRVVR